MSIPGHRYLNGLLATHDVARGHRATAKPVLRAGLQLLAG